MSFTFNWPRFSDQFHYDAIQMLNTALNKGNKPPIIADKIEVVELEMGTQPPELEIRDIGDLTVDQFRGIFRLTYAGDAHLVLKTKVQANPLNHKQPDIHLMGGSRGMLAAKHPLVVPMLLRLSHFRLSSYVVLVVSKQKGITLVFKTDPLQNVDINSTFDSIAVIQNFIQREIEGQLRQMFREDLPGIIHRLSQQWVKAKVEAPYLSKRPPLPTARPTLSTMSSPDILTNMPIAAEVGLHPHLIRKTSLTSLGSRRLRSTSGMSVASGSRPPAVRSPSSVPHSHSPPHETSPSSHPDLENFDPTYGLRPEGLPTKSVFRGFSSLFTPNKGLADLAEEPEMSEVDDYEDEGGSFDFVEWDDSPQGISPAPSVYNDRERESSTEYETIPAVGGGTVMRPRIYHSQSAIQTQTFATLPLSNSLSSLTNRSFSQTGALRPGVAPPSVLSRHQSMASSPYLPDYPAGSSRMSAPGFHSSAASISSASLRAPRTAPPLSYTPGRPRTPDSLESQPSRSSSGPPRTLSTDPTDHTSYEDPTFASSSSAAAAAAADSSIYMRHPRSERRLSVASSTSTRNVEFLSTSPSSHLQHLHEHQDPKIVLINNSIHQLSTLSHSNHTLSPYTRDLSHFTVRSVPPRGPGGHVGFNAAMERQPVKAKRKRTYRIGGQKSTAEAPPEPYPDDRPRDVPSHPSSPTPPSEFDVEDMDRYFRTHDDLQTTSTRATRRPPPPPLRPSGAVASTTTSSNRVRQRPRQTYAPTQ